MPSDTILNKFAPGRVIAPSGYLWISAPNAGVIDYGQEVYTLGDTDYILVRACVVDAIRTEQELLNQGLYSVPGRTEAKKG